MRKSGHLSLITLITVVGIVSAACSGGGGGKGKGLGGDAVKGREAYSSTCVSCHGADAKGMIGLGKSLVTPTDWMKAQSDQALLDFLKLGRPATDALNTTKVDMPPKGGNPALTEDDLKNIIAYIRSIQK